MAEKQTVRIVLNGSTFRKYKIFCAIQNMSMTDKTNELIKKFVEDTEKTCKIVITEEK